MPEEQIDPVIRARYNQDRNDWILIIRLATGFLISYVILKWILPMYLVQDVESYCKK